MRSPGFACSHPSAWRKSWQHPRAPKPNCVSPTDWVVILSGKDIPISRC
jgi:hypothetical protein